MAEESSTRSSARFSTNTAPKKAISLVQPGGAKHRAFPELFALVIGINKYKNSTGTSGFGDLTHCVGDADEVAKFLEVKLGVPNDNIRNLRDQDNIRNSREQDATRDNIINGIKAFGTDPRIKKGSSSIFIFYAGHGSTSKHLHTDLQYEVLCPSDVTTTDDPRKNDPNNKMRSGIADYEIQKLINGVAKEKGNNITIFLDCCHSAGMNRKDTEASERRMYNPTPLSDRDFPVEEGNRDGAIIPILADRNHRSHVLVAACGKNESARECPHIGHGWMTNALLRLLGQVPVDGLTYESLLNNLEVTCRICTRNDPVGYRRQTPHCDGENMNRQLFVTSTARSLIRGQAGSLKTIPFGLLAGILPQARFNIYQSDDESKDPLGMLVATEVTAAVSKLDFLPSQEEFWMPAQFFAKQLSRFTNFSVFCEGEKKLEALFPQHELFGIVSSDDKDSADALVEAEDVDGVAVIYRGQEHPENKVLGNVLRKMSVLELPTTLHDAAAFYHHLKRIGPTTFDKVTVKLLHLVVGPGIGGPEVTGIESEVDLQDQADSLYTKKATVVADTLIEGRLWTKPLGLKIHNESDEDLYPYVFVFTPGLLKIQKWHTIAHAEKPDVPLPRHTALAIGFEGNASPWGFNFDPANGLKHDVAYIKIFFTTIPCPELENIAQEPSPAGFGGAALTITADHSDGRSGGVFPGFGKPKVSPVMPVLCQWGVQVIEVAQQLKDVDP